MGSVDLVALLISRRHGAGYFAGPVTLPPPSPSPASSSTVWLLGFIVAVSEPLLRSPATKIASSFTRRSTRIRPPLQMHAYAIVRLLIDEAALHINSVLLLHFLWMDLLSVSAAPAHTLLAALSARRRRGCGHSQTCRGSLRVAVLRAPHSFARYVLHDIALGWRSGHPPTQSQSAIESWRRPSRQIFSKSYKRHPSWFAVWMPILFALLVLHCQCRACSICMLIDEASAWQHRHSRLVCSLFSQRHFSSLALCERIPFVLLLPHRRHLGCVRALTAAVPVVDVECLNGDIRDAALAMRNQLFSFLATVVPGEALRLQRVVTVVALAVAAGAWMTSLATA
ncbi:hypothetical protein R3P38DRAFT_3175479 [Favolaschia claudopus]|uniref:Uncharacterized protein n=1 Tax=Favolaschia claudopus TaxID=2862362 RepID=A0AAW0D4G9_9AGAR